MSTSFTLPKPVLTSPHLVMTQEPSTPAEQFAFNVACKQEDLARGLALVKVAVMRSTTLPILKNIRLSTDQHRLKLSGTDLEIGIEVWIDTTIQTPGTIVVPTDLFRGIVSTLPPAHVKLSVPYASSTLTISCPGTKTTVRSNADPREFPAIPGLAGGEPSTKVDAGQLKKMIHHVVFAAEKDKTDQLKALWTNVSMTIDLTGELTLVAATDLQLVEYSIPLPQGAWTNPSTILVPAENMAKLAEILPEHGSVAIGITPKKNQVIFLLEQGESVSIVSRLVAGTFPNYKQVLPKDHQTRVVVETKQLAKVIKRAAFFAVSGQKMVRLTVLAAGESGTQSGGLVVDASDADLGESISTLTAEVTGPTQRIFFPIQKLDQALDHIDTPQVAFEMIEAGRPVLIKPVGGIAYLNLLQTPSATKV